MSTVPCLDMMIGRYPNTAALCDGIVTSDLVDLRLHVRTPAHTAFREVVHDLAFDVSELAVVTYFQAKAAGVPLVALPLVLIGRFQHEFLVASADRPMAPADLARGRIGVRAYSVTTSVWLRGMLQDDYAVASDGITWVTLHSGHVDGYEDPPNVVRDETGRSLDELLAAGEIDAAILGTPSDETRPWPTVSVFNDPLEAAAEWFARTGVVPINHVLVVREQLVATAPELVAEAYRMCVAARALSVADPALDTKVQGAGIDLAYGVGVPALRPSLEIVARYAFEQHLIPNPITVEEMFGDVERILD